MFSDNEPDSDSDDITLMILANRFESAIEEGRALFFDDEELEDLIEHYFKLGDFALAKKVADFGISQNQFSALFYIKSAHVAAVEADYAKAYELLFQAEMLEPTNFEIYLLRGIALDNEEKHLEAIRSLKKAEDLAEDQVDIVYETMASVYLNWGKFSSSIYYNQMGLKLNPEKKTALIDINFCYVQLGDLDASVNFFKNYIDSDPYSETAWYLLATNYQDLGLFEKAIHAYEYSLLIDDTQGAAWFQKANSHVSLEEFEEALECYKYAISLDTDNVILLCCAGVCLEKMDENDQAEVLYRKALTIEPDFHEAHFGLGICALIKGDFTKAIDFLLKAIELDEDNSEYLYNLGEAYFDSENYDLAIESFNKAIEVDPEYLDPRFYLASTLADKFGQWDKALEGLQFAITDPEVESEYQYRLAGFLIERGYEQEGLVTLQKALSKNLSFLKDLFDFAPSLQNNINVISLIDQFKR